MGEEHWKGWRVGVEWSGWR